MSVQFIIYGKPSCGFCNKAVSLMIDNGYSFDYCDVSEDKEGLDFLKKMGFKTVPQVYRYQEESDPEHIGGYTELDKWHRAREGGLNA